MSNTEEYLRTLTKAELIGVALLGISELDDWCGTCPMDLFGSEPKGVKCEKDCDDNSTLLCWCKYFVWKYRKAKQENGK